MGSFVGKVLTGEGDENTHLVASTLFGTCSTPAGTAAKTVALENFNALITGVTVHVLFTNTNTASSPTLNVNSTGAKSIYLHGTSAPGNKTITSWSANSVVSFTYDGTAWRMNDTNICTSANFSELADVLEPLMKAYMLNAAWPVGSIYMSTNSTSPATLFGGTWTQLKDRFLLGAGDSYSNGATGGAATVTLATANLPGHTHTVPAHAHGLNSHVHSVGAHKHSLSGHTHSVPAHSHGLNSHTHSVGAHSHGLNSHTHTYVKSASETGGTALTASQLPKIEGTFPCEVVGQHAEFPTGVFTGTVFNKTMNRFSESLSRQNYNENYGYKISIGGNGTHKHSIATSSANTGASSGSTANSSSFNTGAASGNTANSSALTTGSAGGGNTGNSAAFNSGAASGNTANSSQLTSGSTGSGTAHNNMPPYLVVYMWRRTA